jgi:hypothetical protein
MFLPLFQHEARSGKACQPDVNKLSKLPGIKVRVWQAASEQDLRLRLRMR